MIIKTLPEESDVEAKKERWLISQVREILPELITGAIESKTFFGRTRYVTHVNAFPGNRNDSSILNFMKKNVETVNWLIKSSTNSLGWEYLGAKTGPIPYRYRLIFKIEDVK